MIWHGKIVFDMNKDKNIAVFIAAWNEEKMIGAVIDDVYSVIQNIIIVDDGSNDLTAHVAKQKQVTVLRHCINRGKGVAIRTATEYALKTGVDILIHFDADGQHHAHDIPKLIEPILQDKADVVLGSRFLLPESTNIPFWRKFMLKGAILFTWIFSGLKLSDTHNGLRAFNRKALEQIRITEDRFAYASEILNEIKRLSLRYVEVPVTITYSEYSLHKGQSSWNAIRIAVRLFWRIFFLK